MVHGKYPANRGQKISRTHSRAYVLHTLRPHRAPDLSVFRAITSQCFLPLLGLVTIPTVLVDGLLQGVAVRSATALPDDSGDHAVFVSLRWIGQTACGAAD
jgi:hypothetical protein